MGMAFGISPDDVSLVVEGRFMLRFSCDDPGAESLRVRIDEGAVEKAALRADNMDEQTEAAHDEIERQLHESSEARVLLEALPAISA